MSTRDVVRQALYDAIGWQNGLVEAWPAGSDERAEAMQQVKLYRKILKDRYGESLLPDERAIVGARRVGIDELRAMSENRPAKNGTNA